MRDIWRELQIYYKTSLVCVILLVGSAIFEKITGTIGEFICCLLGIANIIVIVMRDPKIRRRMPF